MFSTAEGGGASGEAGEAAVDYDFGALNVGRVVAREEEDGASDLIGFRPATEGNDLRKSGGSGGGLWGGGQGLPQWGAREAGRHDVDANLARAQFGGENAGHRAHRGLATGIRGVGGCADHT